MKRLSKMGAMGFVTLIAILGGRALLHENRMNLHADRVAEEKALSTKIERVLAGESAQATEPSHLAETRKSPEGTSTTQTTKTASVASQQKHQLQYNPSYLAEWSAEDQFIDYLKVKGYPDDYRWQFIFQDKYWTTKQADEAGYIDRITGDPKALPPGVIELQGPTLLFNITNFPKWYEGDWVLTWEGNGEAYMPDRTINVRSNKSSAQGGRIVFSVTSATTTQFRPQFRNLRSPIHNVKLYRLRHEEQFKSGKVWNPDFLSYLKQYDIVRTMVLQDTNSTPARLWNEIARTSDPHYLYKGPVISDREISSYGRYGLPFELLFTLAQESDTALWVNIPTQIGAPQSYLDVAGDLQKILQNAQTNARAIVESSEWDVFAREFTKRLIASNYPKDKQLYIELGNEIWNYGWPFAINSKYAEGIAKGFKPNQNLRYGYGILSARMMVAFENALENSGYSPIYVIGSQTAIPDFTRVAYLGMTDYLQSQNLNPEQWISLTGVALTTYHGGAEAYKNVVTPRAGETLTQTWEREISQDPERMKKILHAYYTRSDENTILTKEWILAMWRAHQNIAQQFGTQLIGAYEGGSHDTPPPELADSNIFIDWWKDYHWGTWGSDVVRQINQSVINEFPGTILSDFTSIGPIGDVHAPWFDRSYSQETPMSRMWREFDRVE